MLDFSSFLTGICVAIAIWALFDERTITDDHH